MISIAFVWLNRSFLDSNETVYDKLSAYIESFLPSNNQNTNSIPSLTLRVTRQDRFASTPQLLYSTTIMDSGTTLSLWTNVLKYLVRFLLVSRFSMIWSFVFI